MWSVFCCVYFTTIRKEGRRERKEGRKYMGGGEGKGRGGREGKECLVEPIEI